MIGGVQNFKKVLESGNNEKLRRQKKPSSHSNNNNNRNSESSFYYNDGALGDGPEAGKDYLLSLMFSHFDQNNNGALEYDELEKVSTKNTFTYALHVLVLL